MRRGLIPWLILGLVGITFSAEIETEAAFEAFVDGGDDEFILAPEAKEIRATRQISRSFVRRRQRARENNENIAITTARSPPAFERRLENLHRPNRQFRMRRPPPPRPMFFRRRLPRPFQRPPQPPPISAPLQQQRLRPPQPPQSPPHFVRPEARIPQPPPPPPSPSPPSSPPPAPSSQSSPRPQSQFAPFSTRIQKGRRIRPTTLRPGPGAIPQQSQPSTMSAARQNFSPSIPTAPPTFAPQSAPNIGSTANLRTTITASTTRKQQEASQPLLASQIPQRPQNDFDPNARKTLTRLPPQATRRFNLAGSHFTRPPPTAPPRAASRLPINPSFPTLAASSLPPNTQFSTKFQTSQTTRTQTFAPAAPSTSFSPQFTNPTTTVSRPPSTFSPSTTTTTRFTNPTSSSLPTTQFQTTTQTRLPLTSPTVSTAPTVPTAPTFTTRGPAPPAPPSTTLTSRPSFSTSSIPSPPSPPAAPALLAPPPPNPNLNANLIDEPIPPARQPGLQVIHFPTIPGSPAALPPDDVIVNALNVAEDFMAVARRFNLRRAMRRKRMAEWQRARI